jgi:hypothetical protein
MTDVRWKILTNGEVKGYNDSVLYLAAWNVISLFFTHGLSQLEFQKYKTIIAVVQETERKGERTNNMQS